MWGFPSLRRGLPGWSDKGARVGRAGMAREVLLHAWACRREARRILKERVGADEVLWGICVTICPPIQMVRTNPPIEKDS